MFHSKKVHKTTQKPSVHDDDDDVVLAPVPDKVEASTDNSNASIPGPKKRFAWLRTKRGKLMLGIGGILLFVGILAAIPFSRYAMLGVVVKHDIGIVVVDTTTGKPVTEAEVLIAGKSAKTNEQGKVIVAKVPTGNHEVTAKKRYYTHTTQKILVGFKKPGDTKVNLSATGRQVQLKVLNTLTRKPLEKATVAVLDTTATTNAKGEATIVVPAEKLTEKARVTLPGYNDTQATIQVIESIDPRNTITLTPAGKIYFLSKRTGKIDVMKSNLDGTNQAVVLAGTGREEENDTVLLAARDWKYLALKSKRDSDKPKLYLITTATDTVSVIDEGNADFRPAGWYNDSFVFTVFRSSSNDYWKTGRHVIKSFHAASGKLTKLDESQGDGPNGSDYAVESISSPYILNDEIAYTKVWSGAPARLSGKKSALYSVKPNGNDKKIIKEFDSAAVNSVNLRLYAPQELYLSMYDRQGTSSSVFEYEHGKIEATDEISADELSNKNYPTYLLSPSGQKTFWYEARDGKDTSFIGNADAKESKAISGVDELQPYGWYGDEYLLMSKNDSELYIMAVDNTQKATTLKITDYHKPAVNFSGYGYGYGGI